MEVHAQTCVGPLLEAHPELEDTLLALSPAFARLKNPVLRATLARFATLEHAARVSGVPLPTLVNTLRGALGQAPMGPVAEAPSLVRDDWPEWFDETRVVTTLDVTAMLAEGTHPLALVRRLLAEHPAGAIVRLRSPFEPAPLLDHALEEGWWTAVLKEGEAYLTALRRP
ncbi:MAG: DUF1858 domain-containing protein [Acidobacteria bacterium]|nr:DUF1858 domain-containing protein [Acidobacteriota bacterium]